MQTPQPSCEKEAIHLNSSPSSPSPSSSSTAMRLWKPAAQRNLRNQWSKFLSHKNGWISASSSGRAHATSLVNAHLHLRFMPKMDLGVLSEMPGIQHKAFGKLALQQEQYKRKLLSCYKDMVDVVSHMTNVCTSMRCFLKGPAGGSLVQFGTHPEDSSDSGDGGGIRVFSSLSIPSFENLGQELLQMFVLELSLKRLLVVELLSLSCKESPKGQTSRLSWSDELYQGEFDDLSAINLYSDEQCQPVAPSIIGWESGKRTSERTDHLPDPEILQVYLTAWLVEVNIDSHSLVIHPQCRPPSAHFGRLSPGVCKTTGITRSVSTMDLGRSNICDCWGGNACKAFMKLSFKQKPCPRLRLFPLP